MDHKEERAEKVAESEHLVQDEAEMNLKAHEQHADTLSECVRHDLAEPDDRSCVKCSDPPQKAP